MRFYEVANEDHILKYGEQIKWNSPHTMIRNACTSCPACTHRCSRTKEHIICSHGDVDHIWAIAPNSRESKPILAFGTSIGHVLPINTLYEELNNIRTEYGLKKPPWRYIDDP